MSNTTDNSPNVAEQYSAIHDEHQHYNKVSTQSDLIALAGVAGLYSWIIAQHDSSCLYWLVGPVFIGFAWLRGHTTAKRAEQLRELLDDMETAAISENTALQEARKNRRWWGEGPNPKSESWFRRREACLFKNAWWLFWGGLFAFSLLAPLVKWLAHKLCC